MLTQKRLKEVLHYDPETGIFIRKEITRGAKAGTTVGSKSAQGYISMVINYKRYYAHRLAWFYITGKWPDSQIDHLDHNKSNNIFINLREVTPQENAKNQPLLKNNTSGVTGVSWSRFYKKWVAQITFNKEHTIIGYFTDKFEAICARKSIENKLGFHKNHGK